MGVNMNFLMNLIQLGLDVGILALCCEAVFRQKSEIKAKDFFIFPRSFLFENNWGTQFASYKDSYYQKNWT